jgi:small subunit ribosomal protein S17
MAKKVLKGIVISDKMNKTRVVLVKRLTKLKKIGKYIKRKKKYKVHDEYNKCRKGDVIKIEECRPLSKDKRFRMIEIVEKGQAELKNDSIAVEVKSS